MQTGPRPGQGMRSWLGWTGGVELANILVFSLLWWVITSGRPAEWPLSALGLVTLDLLLLQGGLYWLLKRRSPARNWPSALRLQLLRLLYAANGLLLLLFPIGIVVRLATAPASIGTADLLLGLGYCLFGLGEFIHYFLFKINMRSWEMRMAWSRRRLVRARIWRELKRAEAAAQGE